MATDERRREAEAGGAGPRDPAPDSEAQVGPPARRWDPAVVALMDRCLSELSAVRTLDSARRGAAGNHCRRHLFPPSAAAFHLLCRTPVMAPAAGAFSISVKTYKSAPPPPLLSPAPSRRQGLVLPRTDVDCRFGLIGRVAAALRRRLRGGSGLMVSEFGSFQSGFAIPGASDLDLALGGELLTDALPVWAQQMLARQLGVGCACRRQRSQRCADARRCIVSLISRCRLSDRLLRHRPPPPLLLPRHP